MNLKFFTRSFVSLGGALRRSREDKAGASEEESSHILSFSPQGETGQKRGTMNASRHGVHAVRTVYSCERHRARSLRELANCAMHCTKSCMLADMHEDAE